MLTRIQYGLIILLILANNTAHSQVAEQIYDSAFNTNIVDPAYKSKHPKVCLDDGHSNAFGYKRKMKGFIKLMQNDGYHLTSDSSGFFNYTNLSKYEILIIGGANGSGNRDTINQAFSPTETDAIYNWVFQGGSLLLLTDHPPFDTSATLLVNRLGAKQGIGIVRDSINYQKENGSNKGWIIFSAENNGLGKHTILSGRNKNEQIRKVLTQGGSSVCGPLNSVNLLTFSKYAENEKHRSGIGPSLLQPAQMIAFELGKGRVVISSDATFFSAQKVTMQNGAKFKLGMSRSDFDNRQLVLNIMHWLSRLL